jgi:hypothetical protein
MMQVHPSVLSTLDATYRRGRQPFTGVKMPPVRRPFDRNSWDVQREHNRYEYPPLDDAAYVARFARLRFRYHPAVAAILAHDPISGLERGRQVKRRRQR